MVHNRSVYHHIPRGDRDGDSERAGLHAVRNNGVLASTELGNAFYGNCRGSGAMDFTAERIEKIGEVHHFRLGGAVIDDGGSLGQARSGHEVLGSARTLEVEIYFRPLQLAGLGGIDAVLYVEFGAQALQALDVEVDRPRADIASARDWNAGKSKSSQEGTENAE